MITKEQVLNLLRNGTSKERLAFLERLPPNSFKEAATSLVISNNPSIVILAFTSLIQQYCEGGAPIYGAVLADAAHDRAVGIWNTIPNHGLEPTTLSNLAYYHVKALSLIGRSEDVIVMADHYIKFYKELGDDENLPSLKVLKIGALVNLQRIDEAEEALRDDPSLLQHPIAGIEAKRLKGWIDQYRAEPTQLRMPQTKSTPELDQTSVSDINELLQELDMESTRWNLGWDPDMESTCSEEENSVEHSSIPRSLIRYPNLDCPDKVILNQRFSFTVELLIDKPEDQEEPLYGQITIEDDGTDLPKVEVVLSHHNFDIENSNTQFIEVKRDNESEVRFVLIPRELGQHKIKVRFYQNDNLIGKATRNIFVSEQHVEVDVEQPDPLVGLELKTSLTTPPQDLELYIDYSENDKTLSFELHSVKEEIGYIRKSQGIKILKGSPLEKMQATYKEMDKLAKLRPETEEDKAKLEQRLASIGNNLWNELIPDKLKQEYWKFKSRVKSVLVLSEEPWIPWEMIKPYRYNDQDEEENDLFWCQRFSISRWLSSNFGTADELEFKTSRSIAPANSNLPSVQAEVDFLEHLSNLYPEIQPLTTFTTSIQVLDSLKHEDLSVFHFACHGSFDSKSPNDSAIKLSDGPLRPSDIISVRFGGKRQRPLIFINACHGGRAEFSFTGLGGWARRMIDSRAGAFIGAMWEVNDKLALQFAKSFYKLFLQDGESIAEAFRLAREEIRKQAPYNSTWLAYTLYADPEGRVKQKIAAH
jgi:hypothetical protein